MENVNKIQSKGIPFYSKVGIASIIIGITLAYSVFQKRLIYKDIGKEGPILESIPRLSLKNFYTQEILDENVLLSKSNALTLVHFWGTWCAPCEAELPDFINFVKKVDIKNITVLLLAVNDNEKSMKKFLKRFGTLPGNFIVAHDKTGLTMPKFGTVKVPETYLFNKSGKNLNKYIGPQDWLSKGHIDRLNFYISSTLGETVKGYIKSH